MNKLLSSCCVNAIVKVDYSMCLQCKGGRNYCGLGYCPLYKRMEIQAPIKNSVKESVFGPSPPNVFVGKAGYPNVSWGPMVSLEDRVSSVHSDDPSSWYGLSLEEIIRLRSNVVRSTQNTGIFERPRLLERAQEVVLSVKPVDVEVDFTRKPLLNVEFSPVTQPMGPSGPLKDFRVCENPTVPRRVDSVVNEGLKATEAMGELYSHGFDVYYLTKLLSSATLGKDERRKLVPTRWSITATDDSIAKALLEKVREYETIDGHYVFSNEYLDNHFEVLLMPGNWEFEQFEAWAPGTLWTQEARKYSLVQEHEGYWGRTKYAEKEAGGYYAGRLGVVEWLHSVKKQARAVIFREVREGYVLPVGVWEVRENVRHAMQKQPKKFASLGEALEDVKTRLKVPMREYLAKSQVLTQTRLDYF